MEKKIIAWIKNKYISACFFTLVWLVFLADKDLFFVLSNKAKLKDLVQEEKDLTLDIQNQEEELKALQSSQNLEKFARETYKMKKSNEIIFMISEKP
jgi:cell division protein FtsB